MTESWRHGSCASPDTVERGLLSHGVSRRTPFSAQCLPDQWVSHEAIMKAWKTGSDLLADRVCVPQLLLSGNRINRSVLSSALRILLQGGSSIKLESFVLPEWRNGRRSRLKICRG
jgi:hypothetical protein